MRMTVFSLQPEELPIFQRCQAECDWDLRLSAKKPGLECLELVEGAQAVNVLSDTVITPALWDAWKAAGVRAAVTRTIGMEHMNRDYAASIGIPVFHITYSPASVADYAIMMMLMVLRNVKPMLARYAGQDYTSRGIMGRELPNLTVGIVGAGRIGSTVARHLRGFGCPVCYWSRTPKPELAEFARYVPLDTLLRESDIVTLHLAATEETEGFMDRARLLAMKEGAVLINTARGPLVDTEGLIEALESGHLSGAGLDVFDGDRSIYYRDWKNKPVNHRNMAVLNAMPNVLMLPHMAYYTDQAAEDMVRNSLLITDAFFQKAGQS